MGGYGKRKGERRRGRGKGGQNRVRTEGTRTGKENTTRRSNAQPLPPRLGTSNKERKLVNDAMREKADGGGESGDDPGYNPTPEDLRLREVYEDWVHGKPGTHLYGRIKDGGKWKGWWCDLVVMPSWHYEAPCGKVGKRYLNALVKELRGVCGRRWNSKRFIVFQTVTLQRAHHVTASLYIRRRTEKRLDAWEDGKHAMIVEDALRSCAQYLTTV